MNRQAPADGYRFGNKAQYRRDIWATFRRTLRQWNVPIGDAHALVMPSAEGDEVEVALNAGFREENLHLVDKNRAIAANLKKRYRRATCYGVEVSRAALRMQRGGIRLSVANLDLCGTVTSAGLPVATVVASGVLADLSLVAITAQRGRERNVLFRQHVAQIERVLPRREAAGPNSILSRFPDLNAMDLARLQYLNNLLKTNHDFRNGGYDYGWLRRGQYQRDRLTMFWAVAVLERTRERVNGRTA